MAGEGGGQIKDGLCGGRRQTTKKRRQTKGQSALLFCRRSSGTAGMPGMYGMRARCRYLSPSLLSLFDDDDDVLHSEECASVEQDVRRTRRSPKKRFEAQAAMTKTPIQQIFWFGLITGRAPAMKLRRAVRSAATVEIDREERGEG